MATALRDTQHIGRIIVDPVDSDTVYVAALGRLWRPNAERGVFKNTDGGRIWANVRSVWVQINIGDGMYAQPDPNDPARLH